MKHATIRFYAELNDFLPFPRRGREFLCPIRGTPTAKELIESLGIPHTEVEIILANGISVGFSYAVQEGDCLSVYPVFEALDVRPLLRLRPKPLRVTRFVADVHLGRLAAYLRLLGFDTAYGPDLDDERLAEISGGERRILLSRDRGLLMRESVSHGLYVHETRPRDQLVEVLRRVDLFRDIAPFTRCLRCNQLLVAAAKEEVFSRLPPRIRDGFNEFKQCPGCTRVYWRGSHYERLREFIAQVMM